MSMNSGKFLQLPKKPLELSFISDVVVLPKKTSSLFVNAPSRAIFSKNLQLQHFNLISFKEDFQKLSDLLPTGNLRRWREKILVSPHFTLGREGERCDPTPLFLPQKSGNARVL